MPIPKPKPRENQDDFMARCMHAIRNEFDSQDQRVAVCMRTFADAQKPKKDEAVTMGPIETKDFGLEVKQVNEAGSFEGYASTFGNVDSGGDKMAPGAFADSMAQHYRKGTMPLMLWSHDPRSPIGTWADVSEDGKGLYVKGNLLVGQNVPDADKIHSLLKAKAIRGLSIGYRVVDSENDGLIRVLKQVDLPEISVVGFPMNDRARVDAVKSETEISAITNWKRFESLARKFRDGEPMAIKEFEEMLRDAGFPRKAAVIIASNGYAKAIRSESDGEATSALTRLSAAVKAFT